MLNIFHNRECSAVNRPGGGLVRLPGNTAIAVGGGGVLLGQATLGQHPPGVCAGTIGHGRGVGLRTFPLTNWTLASCLDVFQKCGGGRHSPATWNTRITALQSFVSYCQRNKWIDHDPMVLIASPAGTPRSDQSHPLPETWKQLWSQRDIHLREKTSVEDAVRNRRPGRGNPGAQCGRPGPGPQTSRDHWQRRPQRIRVLGIRHGAASCQDIWLADAGGRCFSPFVAPTSSPPEETNAHTPAGEDCPTNAPPHYSNKPPGGWTLHQLRHSSLTHLGEKGASTILLQAKSRHQDPRTLAIYTKPGNEAIAQLTSAFDKQRRSR